LSPVGRSDQAPTDNVGRDQVENPGMTPPVDVATRTTIVAVAGVGALLLVVAPRAARALGTIAHESGHVIAGILTGHVIRYFEVTSGGEGGTLPATSRWGPGRIIMTLGGYVASPLFGLAGAALFNAGRIPLLLWTVVALLVLALIKAEREWTTFVVLLLAAATAYVALHGTPLLQTGFAAWLVWLLLFDGLVSALVAGKQKNTDPDRLFRDTLIPRTVWKAGFVVVAIVCLWKGVRLMAS
jgi:hypothetical protein